MTKQSGVFSSNTIGIAKERFLNSFDESGKFVLQSQDLVEVLKLGRKDLNKDEMSQEDFDVLVHEMKIKLTGHEIQIFDKYFEEAKEQYKILLAESLARKDREDVEMIKYIEQRKAKGKKLRKQFGLGTKTPESSEQLGMSEELIQEAISRNKTYNTIYNTDEQVREVCSKLNYTREPLGNGREKHTINGKVFSFPKNDEFTFAEMRDENGKYTMDIMSKRGKEKYETFQNETGMNKLSPDKVYELLGEFAQAMGITSTIDYNFFKGNSAESQGLLQMFRNITGFEGRIPLNITNKGNVVEFLSCYSDCGFGRASYDDYYDVDFISGL